VFQNEYCFKKAELFSLLKYNEHFVIFFLSGFNRRSLRKWCPADKFLVVKMVNVSHFPRDNPSSSLRSPVQLGGEKSFGKYFRFLPPPFGVLSQGGRRRAIPLTEGVDFASAKDGGGKYKFSFRKE
jgi:hypothetical protein